MPALRYVVPLCVERLEKLSVSMAGVKAQYTQWFVAQHKYADLLVWPCSSRDGAGHYLRDAVRPLCTWYLVGFLLSPGDEE